MKNILNLALCFVLSACAGWGPTEPEIKPDPTVTIRIEPKTVRLGESVKIEVCGNLFRVIDVDPGSFTAVKCPSFTTVYPERSMRFTATAIGNDSSSGRAVQAWDSVTVIQPPPPTTGEVLFASVPTGTTVTVSRWTDAGWMFQLTTTSDRKHTLPFGYYRGMFADPSGAYLSCTAYGVVQAGLNPPITCQLVKKPDPPAPPPPIPPGKLVAACSVAGVQATIRRLGVSGATATALALGVEVELEAGFVEIIFRDPTGARPTDTQVVALNSGQRTQVNCNMPLPPAPPPPPLPPQMCEATVKFSSHKYVVSESNLQTNLVKDNTAIDPGFEGPVQIRLQLISARADRTDQVAISRRNPLTGVVVDRAKQADGSILTVDPVGVNGIVWINGGTFPNWNGEYHMILEHGSLHNGNPVLPWNTVEVEGVWLTGKRRC